MSTQKSPFSLVRSWMHCFTAMVVTLLQYVKKMDGMMKLVLNK